MIDYALGAAGSVSGPAGVAPGVSQMQIIDQLPYSPFLQVLTFIELAAP